MSTGTSREEFASLTGPILCIVQTPSKAKVLQFFCKRWRLLLVQLPANGHEFHLGTPLRFVVHFNAKFDVRSVLHAAPDLRRRQFPAAACCSGANKDFGVWG